MIDWLHRHGVTRDSVGWGWAKVVALAGLIVSGALKPSDLGLTDQQSHVVSFICSVVLYLAGQASTSPLPGKPPS